MMSRNHIISHALLYAFFGFVFVNLMYLNYIVAFDRSRVGSFFASQTATDDEEASICDTDECIPQIYEAIYNATASSRTTSPTPIPNQATQPVTSSAAEYYIALGSGTSSAGEWENVGGAAAYVDSNAYGNIAQVTFEASVFVPTGNQQVWVQLYNVTDNHPVWFSQVTMTGGQPQLLISSPITLDSGTKLYQAQIMTQLQFPAQLTQSRIHIVTQ